MGANSQAGFDIVIPTVKGNVAEKTSQGLIMCLVKSDETFIETIQPRLLDAMDPVEMGFLGDDEQLATPIIRIVFALAEKSPAIRHVETQKEGNFTSYDIWISKNVLICVNFLQLANHRMKRPSDLPVLSFWLESHIGPFPQRRKIPSSSKCLDLEPSQF
jgi:hypothetical protein